MRPVKKARKKPTVKRRVRQLERRVHRMDVEAQETDDVIFRVRRDVEFLGGEVRRYDAIIDDQSKRIGSVEDHQWWSENPF